MRWRASVRPGLEREEYCSRAGARLRHQQCRSLHAAVHPPRRGAREGGGSAAVTATFTSAESDVIIVSRQTRREPPESRDLLQACCKRGANLIVMIRADSRSSAMLEMCVKLAPTCEAPRPAQVSSVRALRPEYVQPHGTSQARRDREPFRRRNGADCGSNQVCASRATFARAEARSLLGRACRSTSTAPTMRGVSSRSVS